MITRFATLISRLGLMLTIAFTVAACGGGGGGGGGGFLPDSGNDNTYFVAVRLLDASGNPTTVVTAAQPGTIEVTVTKNKKSGAAVAEVVVRASADIGTIFPSSGSALTDANGVAIFTIEAGTGKGAGTITTSVNDPQGTEKQASLTFQIGNSSDLRLGYFDSNGAFMPGEIGIAPSSTVSAQGQAQLTVAIVDSQDQRVGSAETVTFNSSCLASGESTISPVNPLQTSTGQVTTTYTAISCSGADNITASLAGTTVQAISTLTVAPAEANRITFQSAEPKLIVLRGTGGGPNRQDFSDVTFKVVDGNNAPLAGIGVDFSLTTFVGGLAVVPASGVSDADGLVKVSVTSGDIPTVVRVIATASGGGGNGNVSTVSDILAVSTGLPDQNSISLAVEAGGFVVGNGMSMDGVTRTLTVSMADKFNNPVPDGTAAVFTTEYGTIDPSCTTGLTNGDRLGGTPITGQCSVQWSSGEPRSPTLGSIASTIKTINDPDYSCPSHNGNSGPCPDDLGPTRGGRSTILVTAIGEESFIDRNGNGVMDESEKDLFANVPEAHLDNNEDGIFNPADPACSGSGSNSSACLSGFEEIFTDFNSNGSYDLNDSPAVYNGLLCPQEGDGVWCSRELVNVRDDTVLILSAGESSGWDIALYQGRSPVTGTRYNGGTYSAYISDIFNNSPTSGSTVTVTASGDCTVEGAATFTVPNTTIPGAFGIEFSTGGVGTTGSVVIQLTPAEGGSPYSETFSCTPEPPPDPNGTLVTG